jgi:alpha-D-xyloside xylohydrolase
MRSVPWVCLALSCLGCGGDDDGGDDGPLPPEPTLVAGDYSLDVLYKSGHIDLRRGDEVLVSLPVDAFVLGTVTQLDDLTNYDPEPFLAGSPGAVEPDGLTWQKSRSFRVTQASDDFVEVKIGHDGGLTSFLHLTINGEGSFDAHLAPASPKAQIAYLAVSPAVEESEALYGLGEYFDSVDNRGKLRAMQLEAKGDIESSYNEAHVPVPFVTSTKAWGLFVEDPYPAVFDVGKTDPTRVTATFGKGLASTEGLHFHLFGAAHPLDVTKRYYEVTGYPRLPAPWGLGPLVWRDENVDQAQVEGDLDAMRTLDLPTSAIWIDRPYATGVNTFDFDVAKFPDSTAMIQKAHDLGFRMSLWHTPYLDEADPSTQALRDEATQNGYYPPAHGIVLNKWGVPIDLTNPNAFAWWQSNIQKYVDMGIEGFKLDYGEDIVPGVFGARSVWEFADGSDERTMHSQYRVLYHRVYGDLLPEEGNFLLCRGGTYGDQVNVSVIWPGDLDADFSKHGEKIDGPDGSYNSVGGLPAALIAGLTLGPSGYPFYGADTGGYRHSPPDKELFTRWFQTTALSVVMQIGTSSSDVAWEPTPENGFDQEMLDWYREYTRLHLRLFPYIWTYAKRLATDGRPIQRALGLAYPELGVHPDDTFLLGDHLLAAPVVARAQTSRDVMLPPGKWVDYWTGVSEDGNRSISANAPLDTLPLYLAAGGIVPMLRPTIDTLSPTTSPTTVDSFATSAGVLWARVAPGPASSFVLYDGSELGQNDTGPNVELSSKDGSVFSAGVMFEVIGLGSAPASVVDGSTALGSQAGLAALEAAPSGWFFDPALTGGTLFVKLPPGTHDVTVTR